MSIQTILLILLVLAVFGGFGGGYGLVGWSPAIVLVIVLLIVYSRGRL